MGGTIMNSTFPYILSRCWSLVGGPIEPHVEMGENAL